MKLVRRLVLLGIVGLACATVYYLRPLIPTSDFKVDCVAPDRAIADAKVYRMLFRSNRVYVNIPDETWFCIEWDTKTVYGPNAPGSFPYPHVRHDQDPGVPLTLAIKVGDWSISKEEDGVSFVSSDLLVEVRER